MMKMKGLYLYVTPFFPSRDNWRGGYCFDQVMALKRSGRIGKLVVLKPRGVFQRLPDYEYSGVLVFHFIFLSFPSYILNGLFYHINQFLFLKKLKQFGFAPGDVDVVHCHTTSMGYAALAVKRHNPNALTVLQHHALDPVQIRNGRFASCFWNTHFRAWVGAYIINSVDVNVCISERQRECLYAFPRPAPEEYYKPYCNALLPLRAHAPLHPKRCLILPNGVDTKLFFKSHLSRNGQAFKIGCIGNFTDLKDQLSLIKAVEILRNLHGDISMKLSLVGSGPLKAGCEEYVRLHNLDYIVHFENEVFHEELHNYYNSLDLFVLPGFFEAFGCVFLEAAACGVPFICCRNQGIQEYIAPAERDWWLVPPQQPQILAERIWYFYNKRMPQTIMKTIDINILVVRFLNDLLASSFHGSRK